MASKYPLSFQDRPYCHVSSIQPFAPACHLIVSSLPRTPLLSRRSPLPLLRSHSVEERKNTSPSLPRRPPRAAAPPGGPPLLLSPTGAVHRFQRPALLLGLGWTGQPIAPLHGPRPRASEPARRPARPGSAAPPPLLPRQPRTSRTESGGWKQDPAKSKS